ncbi:MAG: hypothetical protein J7642_12205 [Cyanobacteria bacterium SBC]|nr:hypothetical protein [Cyanobacteria bacterium SBC]
MELRCNLIAYDTKTLVGANGRSPRRQRFQNFINSAYHPNSNRPIALLSYDIPKRPELDIYQVEFPDGEVLKFRYRVVQLNRLNWRDFLRQPNPIAAALMSKMQIAQIDRLKVKAECLRLLVTLRLDPAKTALISGFVDAYLRLNAVEESRFEAELEQFDLLE